MPENEMRALAELGLLDEDLHAEVRGAYQRFHCQDPRLWKHSDQANSRKPHMAQPAKKGIGAA